MYRSTVADRSFAFTRRQLLGGLGALASLGAMPPGTMVRPARAADYPPTDGEMQGFVLADPRRPAADVPFLDGAGNVRHFTDFKGQVLLVNFWATWCAPCIREMPSLAALNKRLGGVDFQLLAVSQDRGGKKVAEPFVRGRLGLADLPIYYDPKAKLGRAMGVDRLPMTFLIDRRGRTVGAKAGYADWDTPEAERLIRHLLREDAAPATQDA